MKKIIITILIALFIPLTALAKEMSKSYINVAFTIDNNYPIMALIAIDSVIQNNISNSNYTFYIVENNITDKNKELMKAFVEKRGQKIDFIHINTNEIDGGKNYFAFSNRITPIAFARILLPDILPDSVHKVLYLDADILITKDLKELYNSNINGYMAGMVLSGVQDNGAGALYRFTHGYYNSGVILFNLDKCRKEKSVNTMLNFLRKNEKNFIIQKGENYLTKWKYPDQDLINVVWDGKIKRLPNNWNNQCMAHQCLVNPQIEKGIIHYIGTSKPWDYEDLYKKTNYNQIYYDFLNNSELSKYKFFFAKEKLKNFFKELIKKKIKRYKLLKTRLFMEKYNMSPFMMFFVQSKDSR